MLLARRNNSNVSNWLNSWFDDNLFDTDLMPRVNATAPAVNVKESGTEYTMEVAAPGLKKEMVKMNIDKDGYLNVSIEHKEEKKENKKEEHYLRREFSYSNYSQSYALPEDANQEKITAEVNNGVLKIEIPKVAKEEKKDDVKHIEVK
ncbi:MAG TPA: heat-shock protein [Prevotella sp.]|nr:heat-shock protein [Prevotella sp.]